MFTGIVTDIGKVISRQGGVFAIACSYPSDSIALGASIACAGCCLTVTSVRAEPGDGTVFTVDVSNETLSITTLGNWRPGTRINLERSLKLGDELGGHMVSGHVDGIARILSITPDGGSTRCRFAVPTELARFVARKGSVALDGTSLTVNEVEGNSFGVNFIPHTLAVTTWGDRTAGDTVNFEVDLMARYVARLGEPATTPMSSSDNGPAHA